MLGQASEGQIELPPGKVCEKNILLQGEQCDQECVTENCIFAE